jgi:hypothetical protein
MRLRELPFCNRLPLGPPFRVICSVFVLLPYFQLIHWDLFYGRTSASVCRAIIN